MIKVKRILQNTFIKVSAANGLIIVGRTAFSVISNKVVALIIGTPGIALVGQLRSFITISTLLSNGGFNQGLTKYVAENKENDSTIKSFVGTAFIVATVLSTFVGLLILIFSCTISKHLFTSESYFSILIVFAVTLLFYNLNSLILAIVNGFQKYKLYFKINISTTIVGFILTISLVLLFKVYGALLAIVLSQSIVFVIAYIYIRRESWVAAFSFKYFKKEKLLLLLKYTSITVLAAVIWPIVDMVIRTYVINNISTQEAGLWQATQNINNYIVSIAIGSFSVYLLPKLSSIINPVEIKNELSNIYKIIIPVTLLGFLVIYVFRDIIIIVLYSKEFSKVGDYLLLQMIGSFFWMCKVPIMNFLLAKGHTNIYLYNELSFALLYVVLSMILIPIYKVPGIQISFAIYNFLYLIVNVLIIKKQLS